MFVQSGWSLTGIGQRRQKAVIAYKVGLSEQLLLFIFMMTVIGQPRAEITEMYHTRRSRNGKYLLINLAKTIISNRCHALVHGCVGHFDLQIMVVI